MAVISSLLLFYIQISNSLTDVQTLWEMLFSISNSHLNTTSRKCILLAICHIKCICFNSPCVTNRPKLVLVEQATSKWSARGGRFTRFRKRYW